MHKRFLIIFITLAVVSLVLSTVMAADRPTEKVEKRVLRTSVYALPTPLQGADEWTPGIESKETPGASLGSLSPSASPGEVLFTSYRDQQHNSTQGRMNDWRPAPLPNGPYAHFGAAFLPAPSFTAAQYAYQVWDPVSGSYPNTGGIGCRVQGAGEYGVYVNLAVDPDDGGVVIAGHDHHGSVPYHTHTYWDGSPMACFFGAGSAIPDTMAQRISLGTSTQLIWPKLEYQKVGGTAVTHLVSYEAGDPVQWGAIAYFRKVGNKGAGTWTGILVDSALNGVSPTVASSRTSQKVAICWTMNTAQGLTEGPNQIDNDVFYKMSTDMGATWGTKVNVTNYVPNVDGYRAYAELSALFASDDKLHIVWPARVWPGNAYAPDGSLGYDCRIFHWSENFPAVYSTVATAEWDQINCLGGAWQLNQAKVTFGECAGRFYTIWTQFNDIPAGVDDDCASAASDAGSSANGDIWMAVSSDLNGLTWDQRRNLTNSYTPGCDSVGFGGVCESDGWSSIARFGMDLDSLTATYGALTWPTPAKTAVFPSYTGSKYIHMQYINDKFPGNIVVPEGIFTLNPAKWIMLPCVDPVPNPILAIRPTSIAYPEYIKHGTQRVETITMENVGNTTLTVDSITKTQLTPVSPNAINISTAGPVTIPAGIGNTATMTVILNPGGVINSPGTTINLTGAVTFWSNSPAPFDVQDYKIALPITDTVVPPVFDTIITNTGRCKLVVSSNGNLGHEGAGKVNLDFWSTDCDTVDSIPGSTNVYLFDASPVILHHKTSPDTVIASWAIFGSSIADANVFKPVADTGHAPRDTVIAGENGFITGTFATVDTVVYVGSGKIHIIITKPDGTQIHIQIEKVYLAPGVVSATGLTFGEAYDIDVPADTGSYNLGGFDASRNLVYQQGYEYKSEVGKECIKNNRRWAGAAMLGYYTNHDLDLDTCANKTDMYGGYTNRNDSFVYPNNGFVPKEMWDNMSNPGFSAEAGPTDLHTVLTFKHNISLAAADTFYFVTATATIYNGTLANLQTAIDDAKAWYMVNYRNCTGCCKGTTGNVDGDPGDLVDISDLSAMVDYLFFGGAISTCAEENDVDKSLSVDISDLQLLIDFLFFGASLPNC
ncbi:MAG: hypothetical protein AB1644_10975 [Candidatus Zixiibacteriota bacterium]